MENFIQKIILSCCMVLLFTYCNDKKEAAPTAQIATMDLKRGEVVSCGPLDKQFGQTSFASSVPGNLKTDFDLGVALLHSFEYDEAEKMFAKVIDNAPDCAIAYWGVAMANFHPLWAPPTPTELEKGANAVRIARSIDNKTNRESAYIDAIGKFYADADKLTHRERILNFEKAMEAIYLDYPDDKEAPVFYALALNAAADPADKTYSRQKKAFTILNGIFEKEPLHPGIAHYIIHNYDYPGLAEMALPAARKYATIAPASAHAQHMPSHIFTRLGLWDESIKSNMVAATSGRCYAEQLKLKGSWDEELHALDYLVYAYLQKGDDDLAKERVEHLQTIKQVDPLNFKVLFAFAASPSRYFLEKRMWKEAAGMKVYPAHFPWEKYPWQKAMIHFTRALGAIHTGKTDQAKNELDTLRSLQALLNKEKNMVREAAQVTVQINTAAAWIHFKEGNNDKALELMTMAADSEDGTEKHPVTPGEIIPARELLGDMLLAMNKPATALIAYDNVLVTHPNRFNALYSAGIAAQETGDKEKAKLYFQKLVKSIGQSNSKRAELEKARLYVSST